MVLFLHVSEILCITGWEGVAQTAVQRMVLN